MLLLHELVESCLDITRRILTVPPSSHHIATDLSLSLLQNLYVKCSSSLLLSQHTLVQNNSSVPVILVLLENSPTNKLFLPKISVVRHHFHSVLEKAIVDSIRVALFEITLKLPHSLLKIFGRIQLKVKLPSHTDLVYELIILRVRLALPVQVDIVLLDKPTEYSA